MRSRTSLTHHLHPLAQPRKPQGQPTRGKTARNRLRRVDTFLLRYDPHLLRRSDGDYTRALFVDLGYGAEPCMVAGEAIYEFFQVWKRAIQMTAAMQEWGLRQWFVASALQLAAAGYRIDQRLGWLRRGYLIWQQG